MLLVCDTESLLILALSRAEYDFVYCPIEVVKAVSTLGVSPIHVNLIYGCVLFREWRDKKVAVVEINGEGNIILPI